MVSVSANVEGRSNGEVIEEARKLAEKMDYPPGFGMDVGGSGKDQKEVFGAMGIALVSGIGLPDKFIDHDDPAKLLALVGLDAAGIAASIKARFGDEPRLVVNNG